MSKVMAGLDAIDKYNVHVKALNTRQHGVPQNRARGRLVKRILFGFICLLGLDLSKWCQLGSFGWDGWFRTLGEVCTSLACDGTKTGAHLSSRLRFRC